MGSSLERKMYDEETFVTRYMDGVYSLYSPKYGVEVIADGERLEVKSPQFIFRNRVTGICGDLNGEWTADIKSSRQCVTPKPKTSAYSFLIESVKVSLNKKSLNFKDRSKDVSERKNSPLKSLTFSNYPSEFNFGTFAGER